MAKFIAREIEYVVRDKTVEAASAQHVLDMINEDGVDAEDHDSGHLLAQAIPLRPDGEPDDFHAVGLAHWPDPWVKRMLTQVCTYNGNAPDYESNKLEEYGEPHHPLVIEAAEGINLWLGTSEPYTPEAFDKPSVLVERQHNKWMVEVQGQSGGDAELHVYIMDDGRVVVVEGTIYTPSNLEYSDKVPD